MMRPKSAGPQPGGLVARVTGAYRAWLMILIGAALPGIMRRAMRRGLAGVWSRYQGVPLRAGAVLVANHHSWWDTYLALGIPGYHGCASAGIMDEAQLERFPFFRRLGVVSRREVRQATRLAAAGHQLIVFLEGSLRAPGPLGPTREGAAVIARWAQVPIVPVAIRVVMRGADRPEAYVLFGEALPSGTDHAQVVATLTALLSRLDADLGAAPDVERPLPEYHPWWPERQRSHERIARWRRFWGAT